MANELKGITVRIDADLHAEIKKYLEDNNMTMAEFITHAVDDELHPKYIAQEENKVEKMRTLAFQVPEDLFQRIKGYLARTGMSQKNFVIGLIEEELDRDEEMRAAENTTVAQDEDTPEESDDIAAGDILDVVDETEDESETYGEGPEDPIYMEGNLGSETEESGEPGYETEGADDPAYLEDADDAYDEDASDEEAYDDAGYDEDEETDDYEETDEEYDSEEVDDEYDDEESEDEDFDEEEDSEDYDEDEDSEEYDEEDDSEEYGEGEYDDEDDEDDEEEEESQSFVMSM